MYDGHGLEAVVHCLTILAHLLLGWRREQTWPVIVNGAERFKEHGTRVQLEQVYVVESVGFHHALAGRRLANLLDMVDAAVWISRLRPFAFGQQLNLLVTEKASTGNPGLLLSNLVDHLLRLSLSGYDTVHA